MIEEPKAYFTLNYTTLVWMTYESHPATGLRSARYALNQEKQVSIKHMFQKNEFAPCKERGQNIIYIYKTQNRSRTIEKYWGAFVQPLLQ